MVVELTAMSPLMLPWNLGARGRRGEGEKGVRQGFGEFLIGGGMYNIRELVWEALLLYFYSFFTFAFFAFSWPGISRGFLRRGREAG